MGLGFGGDGGAEVARGLDLGVWGHMEGPLVMWDWGVGSWGGSKVM